MTCGAKPVSRKRERITAHHKSLSRPFPQAANDNAREEKEKSRGQSTEKREKEEEGRRRRECTRESSRKTVERTQGGKKQTESIRMYRKHRKYARIQERTGNRRKDTREYRQYIETRAVSLHKRTRKKVRA